MHLARREDKQRFGWGAADLFNIDFHIEGVRFMASRGSKNHKTIHCVIIEDFL